MVIYKADENPALTAGLGYITIGAPILPEEPTTKYTVSYDGNGSTGETVPSDSSSPYEQGEP
ncbi:MAG: hypothetical protein ACRC76_05410 [Proteocatella sp.]